MAEIKSALKDAKNAIKEKDFECALAHCKTALKLDRKNYQALVIFGKVCQDLGRHEDSKKSLLLASQVDPEQPVAWQGLSTLQEKEPRLFTLQEAIGILSHICNITAAEEKLETISRRLAAVHQENDSPLKAAEVLRSLVDKLTNERRKIETFRDIMQLLSAIKNPTVDILDKLIESFGKILDDTVLGENEKNYKVYLQTLYKAGRFSLLFTNAEQMAVIFPTAYPLEWLARIYVELKTGLIEDSSLDNVVFGNHINSLLSRHEGSLWGNLAKGLLHVEDGNDGAACACFRIGANIASNTFLPWRLLLESQKRMNDYPGIEVSCRKILSLIVGDQTVCLPKDIKDTESFRHELLMTQSKALFKMGHKKHLLQAIEILEKEPDRDMDSFKTLIHARIKLGDIERATKDLETLSETLSSTVEKGHEIEFLKAYIHREKGELEEAQSIYEYIIQNEPHSAEALFEIGRLYYDQTEYQKSFISLLKAAKHDPKMSSAFLYLGHYYRNQDNFDKARKCYEKALHLCPTDEGAGASLSDVYRITGDHASNLSLLSQVTSQAGRSAGGWAWLRMGLHHIATENHDEAVKALQCAVQINPENSVEYECLGDAYLARGSHTAALKVFTRAAELSTGDALYPKTKIARIKHFVGEHLDSVTDYEVVLKGNPPDAIKVVALIGLAEVLLSRARKHAQSMLLSNLKEDCLYAIRCLCEAAASKSTNVTVWKLLNEACSLQSHLPPSLCQFDVPSRLFDPQIQDLAQLQTLNKQELLQLGARCLGVGIKISECNGSLWHDLGVNLFLQGWSQLSVNTGLDDQESDCFVRATACIKKSLTLEPSNYNAWNSLGTVSFFKGDLVLAQHAFLRSLHVRPSVEAWTHLGLLYFRDIHLAHEAFSQAQALDPGFVASWVGQALVAEFIGHYETFDLFRHTTLLGIHSESCIGHGHQVLRLICDKEALKESKIHRNLKEFLPSASDCLQFYTREKELDAIGHNMSGLLLEMMGLKISAASIFAKAVEVAEDASATPLKLMDSIYFNYSRVLTSLNRLDDAIKYYSKIKEPDFYSQCGLALAKLKDGKYEEAYDNYSSAVYWLAPDNIQKSHALVALAFLQYKFNKIEDVKTLLFQSSCADGSSSVQGLLALTALGLLQGDASLSGAALAELKPYLDSKEFVQHITFLLAAQATLKGNAYEAKLILSRAIHRHPEIASIWRSLSLHLLASASAAASATTAASAPRTAAAAAASASAARAISQAAGDNKLIMQDVVMKTLSSIKSSEIVTKKSKEKLLKAPNKKGTKGQQRSRPQKEEEPHPRKNRPLLDAQRAVLMCPSDPQSWAVLIYTLKDNPKASKLAKCWASKAKPDLQAWLKEVAVN